MKEMTRVMTIQITDVAKHLPAGTNPNLAREEYDNFASDLKSYFNADNVIVSNVQYFERDVYPHTHTYTHTHKEVT